MLKTLLAQVREFKKASFLTPFFMILEVLFETLIPLSMLPSLIRVWKPEISAISIGWVQLW